MFWGAVSMLVVVTARLPQGGRRVLGSGGCAAPSPAPTCRKPILGGGSRHARGGGASQAGLLDLEPHFYRNPEDGSHPGSQYAFVRILGTCFTQGAGPPQGWWLP